MTGTWTEPEFTPVIAWFSELSTVNQFAAGVDPAGWARAQAPDNAKLRAALEERANEWQAYMQRLAEEPA